MNDSCRYEPGTQVPAIPDDDPTHAAVIATGLVRRFASTVAVDGLDLRVRRGEIYGFLGPNGAGKSTVVRILCTLLKPTAGTARVAGYDVARDPKSVRIRIGVALQDAAIDDRQTGRELLTLQGRLYGLSAAHIRMRLGEVLDLVDIGSAIDRRIGTYSGGMKRRLDLAAALVHDPEVLFSTSRPPVSTPRARATVGPRSGRCTSSGAPPSSSRRSTWRRPTRWPTGWASSRAADWWRRVARRPQARSGTTSSWPRWRWKAAGPSTPCAGWRDSFGRGADGTITVNTADGPAALGTVAVALGRTGLHVKSLTMRTPTLDDVFMEMTGSRIDRDEVHS